MSYASDCPAGLNCTRPGCLWLHKPRHRADCTTCFDTGLIDWAIEGDPNCYQEPDGEGKIPCPDCQQRPNEAACRCQIVGFSRDRYEPHIPEQAEWEQAEDCPVHPVYMPAQTGDPS